MVKNILLQMANEREIFEHHSFRYSLLISSTYKWLFHSWAMRVNCAGIPASFTNPTTVQPIQSLSTGSNTISVTKIGQHVDRTNQRQLKIQNDKSEIDATIFSKIFFKTVPQLLNYIVNQLRLIVQRFEVQIFLLLHGLNIFAKKSELIFGTVSS